MSGVIRLNHVPFSVEATTDGGVCITFEGGTESVLVTLSGPESDDLIMEIDAAREGT